MTDASDTKRRGRPFPPGQSGNPAGRKAEIGPLKAKAREHTDAALDTLVKALRSKNERTRVAAAEAILDRGWGRPTQHHEIEAGDDLAKALDAAWERARLADAPAAGSEGTATPLALVN